MNSRKRRIVSLLVVLLFFFSGFAFSQCVSSYSVKQLYSVKGINNGVDHYYQNLIIQDLAIAAREKFEQIEIRGNYQVDFSVDRCKPGLIGFKVLPVSLIGDKIFYQGYDISSSIKPEKADLVFHIRQEKGLVIDSLVVHDVKTEEKESLYYSLSYPDPENSITEIIFARAIFHYSQASYELFRDYILRIDDYYAACMIADSAMKWNDQALPENERIDLMLLKTAEMDRFLQLIKPERFEAAFSSGRSDLLDLKSKYDKLATENKKLKAIISYDQLRKFLPGIVSFQNEITNKYLHRFDFYYKLSFNTNFRFVSFLNRMADPGFTNSDLLSLSRSVKNFQSLGQHAPRVYAGILAQALIERGNANEMEGNQIRALTYYRSATHFSELLNFHEYRDQAKNAARNMADTISSSYLEISMRAALRENPSIAAQYFRDAKSIYADKEFFAGEPEEIREFEAFLFANFEDQVVSCMEKKDFKKAYAYLNEIQTNCRISADYKCPDKFPEWMQVVRTGIYLELLAKARKLNDADEPYESEQIFRQAVEMRQNAGYRIDKNILEAQLEVVYRQIYYDDFVEQGLGYFKNEEYASALFYFNKAEYLEKSGVEQTVSTLMDYRSASARKVISGHLSDGRVKVWAHDFTGAENALAQIAYMLEEYQFAQSDSLTMQYRALKESVLQTECREVLDEYDNLMSEVEKSANEGDYILAKDMASEAVKLSMDHLKCRIADEQAWYQMIRLEPLADFRKKEHELDFLASKSVLEYLLAYQSLKQYYYRNKLLQQGVIFIPLEERVMKYQHENFLTGMLDHYISMKEYDFAVQILRKLYQLNFSPDPLKARQQRLGKLLALRDSAIPSGLKPWEILDNYTNGEKWFRDFIRSYKKTWLKNSGWKLQYWPVIWKK